MEWIDIDVGIIEENYLWDWYCKCLRNHVESLCSYCSWSFWCINRLESQSRDNEKRQLPVDDRCWLINQYLNKTFDANRISGCLLCCTLTPKLHFLYRKFVLDLRNLICNPNFYIIISIKKEKKCWIIIMF